jgi:hypothetical protein
VDVKDKRNLGIFISVTQGNRFGEKINIRNKKIGKINMRATCKFKPLQTANFFS